MLEFNLFLAFVFGIGVCCGVSSWFYLLLSLLKKYKQVRSKVPFRHDCHLRNAMLTGTKCVLLCVVASERSDDRVDYALHGLLPADSRSLLRQVIV